MADSPSTSQTGSSHEADLIETIQSLIVAFVLAMTFRGFVVEGFVIPTGSMAPTLMGAHAQIQSRQSGASFAVGMDQTLPNASAAIADPMFGPGFEGSAMAPNSPQRRMGDRILVLKSLYPFSQPERYDVVVFKNPTKPQGDEANYIKRLIGLPNEEIWLCDGDVFARSAGESDFQVQRKPQHIQRAVWQTVYDSDYLPVNIERLNEESHRRWNGPPWVGDSAVWSVDGRAYRYNGTAPGELRWDSTRRRIDDWLPYNMLASSPPPPTPVPVNDMRVSSTIVPEQDGLVAHLELRVRSHIVEYIIESQRAMIRMRPAEAPAGSAADVVHERAFKGLIAGRATRIECWHVDQQVRLFIDGKEAVEAIDYDWTPMQRLQNASGDFSTTDAAELLDNDALRPDIRWTFEGSPATLHRVRIDRDLFYRRAWIEGNQTRPGYGTHPDTLARLGPDHFMMCGDNSQMSLDSRLWGAPDGLVASQIDPAPFLVNRKLLLGKAWVVYFPAPFPLKEGGVPVVPDFGRLRFIR